MGTTIVAVLVDGDRIIVGHVGDSRAYCLRAGQLRQMTEDDTWLNVMLGAGAAASASDHPMRHVLTSGIGMRVDVEPSLIEEDLHSGEQWLICTDGVHGTLDERATPARVGREFGRRVPRMQPSNRRWRPAPRTTRPLSCLCVAISASRNRPARPPRIMK